MKFIDNYDLFELTNYLTDKEFGLSVLNGKLEAFSLDKNPVINLIVDTKIQADTLLLGCAGKQGTKRSIKLTSGSFSADESYLSKNIDGSKSGKNLQDQLASGLPPPYPQRRRSNSSTGCNHIVKKPLRARATSLGDLAEPSSRRLLFDLISTLDDFFPDYDFDTTKPEQFLIKDVNQLIQCVNGCLAELTEEMPDFLEKLWRSVDDVINLRKCEAFSLVPDMTEDPFSDGTLWSFNYFLFNHDLKQLIYFTCVAKR